MYKKIFMAAILGVFSPLIYAADLTVTNASVTKVQVYETADDSVSVWLHLNGSSRVGPNPVNARETCELWTNDRAVHSTALAALMAGKKVTVTYIDRGEGTFWCKVKTLAVSSN